jgi:Na+-transporting NADH:ubiquinone oxidoreductase subunit NqrB
MKIDPKKVQSLVLTYGVVTLPIATTALAMNASPAVKILSFFSGFLALVIRQGNPKDPFTMNLLKIAEQEVNVELEKKTKKKA